MGQSNADGRAGTIDVSQFVYRDRVSRWEAMDGWSPGGEPWNINGTLYPILNDTNTGGSTGGPILAFGDKLAELRPSAQISVVAATIGSSSITRFISSGDVYSTVIGRAAAALAGSASGSVIKGIIYQQAENDTDSNAHADAWVSNYTALVSQYRSALGLSDLPVILVKLSPDPGTSSSWTYLRNKQDAMTLPSNSDRVTTSDLSLQGGGSPHFTQASIITVGQRAAIALNALL